MCAAAWSRATSLVYSGERDGLGFRDSVQDILGVTAAIPQQARQRLELLLTGQLSNGGAMPIVRPFHHHPGQEKGPAPEEYRSDDCLWFFNAVPAYVGETGDVDFYNRVLPYADQGEATVFGHLRRALEFNLERTGKHGLPCGLAADWNDCLRLGYYGESLFVAFLFDLFPTTRQCPHTLAHRRSGLGILQRHTVHAGAAAGDRRAADCPVHSKQVARLPSHPRLPGSDLSRRRQARRSRQRGFADGGWQPGERERRPPAARRAGGGDGRGRIAVEVKSGLKSMPPW